MQHSCCQLISAHPELVFASDKLDYHCHKHDLFVKRKNYTPCPMLLLPFASLLLYYHTLSIHQLFPFLSVAPHSSPINKPTTYHYLIPCCWLPNRTQKIWQVLLLFIWKSGDKKTSKAALFISLIFEYFQGKFPSMSTLSPAMVLLRSYATKYVPCANTYLILYVYSTC